MKRWNPVSSRRTAGLFLVVAWFLGLLLVTNGALAQTYTPVFSDDFNRSDWVIDNDWIIHNSIWGSSYSLISGNQLVMYNNGQTASTRKNHQLLRPDVEKHLHQEVSIDIPTNGSAAWLLARATTDGQSAYFATIGCNLYYFGFANAGTANSKVWGANKISPNCIPTHQNRLTLSVSGANPTTVTATIFDITSGVNVWTYTFTDTTASLQHSGTVGVYYLALPSQDAPVYLDNFVYTSNDISSSPNINSLTPNTYNMKVWTNVTYTITTTGEQTVNITDNGKGGMFNTTSIVSHSGNNYTTIFTYTPTLAWDATITAIFSDGTSLSSQLFVSPYSTKIGFIGDSITDGQGGSPNGVEVAMTTLGRWFSALNSGNRGSTTTDWLNSLLAWAITTFQNAGVEVVHIMLGTNDVSTVHNVNAETYQANMQEIITRLKNAWIQKIIISSPLYFKLPQSNRNQNSLELLTQYQTKMDELIDGETILRWDRYAYAWFEANSGTAFSDVTHPNSLWYAQLGKYWANAIKSVLDYQISPNASFLSGNAHTLWTTEALTFRVDKYFEEFNGVVKVDNADRTPDKYIATSGSTNIKLNADYLNTLTAGAHTLTVGFEGGVEVVGDFTIFPDPTLPPVTPPITPTVPTSSWWGGGGISLVKDSCPNGDLSPSYYDKTCWTTTDLTEEVAKKVNVLRPVIKLIYLTATEEQKTFVHNLITSCSQTNKNEVIKLACQDLVNNRDF